MLEILQLVISILTGDATLTAIVPAAQILTGPVDIVMEKQADLLYPQINVRIISEVQRSNPLATRDTQIQLDLYSRNSQLELENIYERIITLLAYKIANEGSAHIYWSRLNGAVDFYESDRRIWHRAMTISVWSQK